MKTINIFSMYNLITKINKDLNNCLCLKSQSNEI